MTPSELQRYLHEHIPLTAAMEVKVVSCGPDAAHLSAPLAPNINHRDTAFGGSASALAPFRYTELLLSADAASEACVAIRILEYTVWGWEPCACTYACAPAEPHERVPVRLCREQRRRVAAD